jgi:Carboxypeptidase regulatory-like domain
MPPINHFTHHRELRMRHTSTLMPGRVRGQRTTSGYLVLVLVVMAVGCTKPVIQGRVVDVFKKPVADADISIPKTAFTATTNAEGKYTISFAPGQFDMHIQKKGYTSATVPWNVTQAAELPAAEVMLYPNPEKPGIYYLAADHLELLPTIRIEDRARQIDTWRAERTYAFQFSNAKTPDFAFGSEVRFLDNTGGTFVLYRGDPEFYREEILNTFGHPTTATLDNEVKVATTEVGEEKLRLHSVKLSMAAVYYGWLHPPLKSASSAYAFSVPYQQHAD